MHVHNAFTEHCEHVTMTIQDAGWCRTYWAVYMRHFIASFLDFFCYFLQIAQLVASNILLGNLGFGIW